MLLKQSQRIGAKLVLDTVGEAGQTSEWPGTARSGPGQEEARPL